MKMSPKQIVARVAFAMCVVGVMASTEATAADQQNLVQCRAYDADFDYTGVLTECGVAAGDPRTTPTERLEVFRLLGFAHTALGSPTKAQVWYLKLLVLDPTYKLGRDVSPRFRDGFAKAKRKFKKEGRVRASHAAVVVDEKTPLNEPLPLKVTLSDPLSRVTTVIATVTASPPKGDSAAPVVQDIIFERDEAETGTISFVGALPPLEQLRPEGTTGEVTIKYAVKLQSGMGAVVKPKPRLAPVKFTVDGARLVASATKTAKPDEKAEVVAGTTTTPPATENDESEGLGTGAFVGIGVGGAAAVGLLVTAAVGGGVALVCLQNERCTAPAPRSRPASSARVNVN